MAMIGIRRRVPACSGTASASDSTLPQARHFQMPFFVDATESLLRCPHCAHVAIRAFICNSTIYKLGSATPTSFDVELNRGNLKAESVWLTTHRCRYVTHDRGACSRAGLTIVPGDGRRAGISTRSTGLACTYRDQRRFIPGGLVSRLRGLAGAWLRHLSHRQRAGDDGRLDRARHQLLDRVSEIPVPGARRLRGDLALGAVPVVLGLSRRAGRPL